MLKLPQITLIAMTGLGYQMEETIKALEHSSKEIEFGAIKYIQLNKIKGIDEWNKAIIYDLPKYIETNYCILVHENGFIVNPQSWKDEWLNYDFIGAPWPLPQDDFSYKTKSGKLIRVGNSVSLRSKKLMNLVAIRPMEYHYGNNNEDGQICVWEREFLEENSCKFAPIEVAKYFSREHDISENFDVEKPFCFHYNRFNPGKNKEFAHFLKI